MSLKNDDNILLRNINKFKYTSTSIFKILNYIENNIGEKPKCLTYDSDKWNVKNNKLYFDNKLVVPKSKIKNIVFKIYFDKSQPFGRDGIFDILKENYIGISKNNIQKIINKLHKKGIWLID